MATSWYRDAFQAYAVLAAALAGFVMLATTMLLTLAIDRSGSTTTQVGEAQPATN